MAHADAPPLRALFLCRENARRSIMAEAILRSLAGDSFEVCSAGSHPAGAVDPAVLDLLRSLGHDTSPLRSKSWVEFATSATPPIDFVFTVCDRIDNRDCPSWPGQPILARWGIADPAEQPGTAAMKGLAYREAYCQLRRRIELFLSLPFATLNRLALEGRVRALGRMHVVSNTQTTPRMNDRRTA